MGSDANRVASSSGCGMSNFACFFAASTPCRCSAALRDIVAISIAAPILRIDCNCFSFMSESFIKRLEKR